MHINIVEICSMKFTHGSHLTLHSTDSRVDFQERPGRRGLRPRHRCVLRRRVSLAALRGRHKGLGGVGLGLGGSAAATAAVALRSPSPGGMMWDDVGCYMMLLLSVFFGGRGEAIF